MKIRHPLIAAALSAAAVAAATAAIFAWNARFSDLPIYVPTGPSGQAQTVGRVIPIDVAGLQRLMAVDPNLVIIDVRLAKERTGPLGYIPNSLAIPEKTVLEHPESLPSGKTLVFICYSGPRSIKTARKAASLGITSYYVKGGMVAWRQYERSKSGGQGRSKPVSPEEPDESPSENPFFGKDMGC
jgi:rhodanese-related sulfurtransferase